MPRHRLTYFFYILCVIGLGLLSRTCYIPELIYPYLGDFLYAVMFYCIVAFLFKNKSSKYIFLISVSICYLIECQQLLSFDWLIAFRNTTVGSLILGHGFLWSDIVSYTLGGITAFGLEKTGLLKKKIAF
ncbi:ribosomal maturation YjgA family protein [Flammeovirga pacifica]|uniref:DUF2809 domain-containing protein n=1 Tax=Flammeovirga pacifica TaxID=915059 RepID=A0A1S1Z3T0_FLAPC|nr:DUF2809 domain-containing protein [Flammeovirga pacifica]OHX67930.1 hypothetical protein NH26_17075 [Flammeovirga pacifica]